MLHCVPSLIIQIGMQTGFQMLQSMIIQILS